MVNMIVYIAVLILFFAWFFTIVNNDGVTVVVRNAQAQSDNKTPITDLLASPNTNARISSLPENDTAVLHQSDASDQNPSTTVPTEVKLTGNSTNFQLQLAGVSGFNLTGSLKELFSSLAKNGTGAEWSLAGTVLHAEPSQTDNNSSTESLTTSAVNSSAATSDLTTPAAGINPTAADIESNLNSSMNNPTENVTFAPNTAPASASVTGVSEPVMNVTTTLAPENITITTVPPPQPLPQLAQPCVNILPMCGFMAESPRLRFEMMAGG